MQIHVARQQQQLGVFAPEDIVAGLSSGRFHPSDLAWREGLAAWTPLGDWPEFRGAGLPPPSPSGHAQSAEVPVMPSWERGASLGNFIATIKEVALDPARTFANLRDGGFARPISFTYWTLLPAWLCGSLLYGALFGFIASMGSANFPAGTNDPFLAWVAGVGPLMAALAISVFLGVVFLFVPLFNFVGAAITHLLLLPWGPSGSYAQTYRANAYAYGAFMPFAFIPCLNYVAMPWQLVAAIIAHSQVHRIAWWKVAISLVVIPCLCVCGIYAMLFAVVAKSFAG